MKKLQPRIIGVNALGAIGYMLMWIGWILLIAVILALLMERSVIVPMQPIETTESQPMFTGLATGVAYTIATVMVVFTIGVFVLLPYLVGRWSSSALRGLLKLLRVAQVKHGLFLLKSVVAILPLVGFFVVALLLTAPTMLFSMLYMLAVVVATATLIVFWLQLIIARILRVPERSVW